MLIYNFQKEFLGIDKHDLEALGFSNLAELRAESEDFADLFVKTPGHLQNFKHAHWIDFLLYPEDTDENKVIIQAKGKNYKCVLNLKIAYLVDNPSQEAYIINLQNLRELTTDEVKQISIDLDEREEPKPATNDSQVINIPKTKKRKHIINKEIPNEIIQQEEKRVEPSHADIPTQIIHKEEDEKKDDTPIDISFDDEDDITFVPQSVDRKVQDIKEETSDEIVEPEPQEVYTDVLDDELELPDYIYDPKIASEELGMPIDEIKEFTEEFIAQAKSFKDGLFSSLDSGNIAELKRLSHILKGVAANLRIEDARDALIIINTSDDINKVKSNLTLFYKIIAKMENKNLIQKTPAKDTKEINIVQNNPTEYDKNLVAEELGLDMESFNEEFEKFINNAKASKDELYTAVDNSNLAQVQTLSYKLKEMATNLLIEDAKEPLFTINTSQDINEIKTNLTLFYKIIEKLGNKEQNDTLGYDKNLVAQEIGLDMDSFNEIFENFIQEAKKISESITEQIAQNDSQKWKQSAVFLRTISENMRLDIYKDELEDLIKTDDSTQAKTCIDEINSVISKLDS